MFGDRGSSVLNHPVQWEHCAHDNTTLVPGGGVELTWADPDTSADRTAATDGEPAGLTFDAGCVGYRTWPGRGTVTALRAGDRADPRHPGLYHRPRGLAVDRAGRLYVTEEGDPTGPGGVLVSDLAAGRVLRRVSLAPGRPIDVAAVCGRALVLTAEPDGVVRNRLWWLEGRRSPRPGPTPAAPCPANGADGRPLRPRRVAVLGSDPLLLWAGGRRGLVARTDGTVELEVDRATDLVVDRTGLLVVGASPGSPFRRFRAESGGWLEIEPVGAPGYDGGAIASTPAGRIAFTTATGYATTTGSAARRVRAGTVTTYRFDSGNYRTRWGRLFLDACLPTNTEVRVRFVTSDDEEVLDQLPWTGPARSSLTGPRTASADYPPLPSQLLLGAAGDSTAVFCRPTGPEEPWLPALDQTYETPVRAEPGRYLWLQLELTGTTQSSPRIRALRIERPGHRLLQTLPKAWSRNAGEADFLQRYLAPVEGTLHELDWRAAERAILLSPGTSPAECLDWLAGFAGLVLDRRWPEAARRRLIAEAYPLFARRGTQAALTRMLELYLGRAPTLVENWRLRGLGGTVLGTRPGAALLGGTGGPRPAPVVGGSASETGTLGRFSLGGGAADRDAYADSAHRLTVLIPGTLTAEQRAVVDGLLETHRPAQVVIERCELGSGMRVGERMRVALTTFVGPGAGWREAQLGRTGVGTDAIVGRAAIGGRVGESAVAGRVRVG